MIFNFFHKISAERTDFENPRVSPFFFQEQRVYSFAKTYCKDKTVLEIGSGDGYGANRLAEAAKKVIAIDKDKATISLSKNRFKKSNLKFLNVDIESYMPKEKVDVIVSFQVLEHIIPENIKLYFEAISNSLKKSGLCIISTPNSITSSYNENPYHYKEFTSSELQRLLSLYFKNVKMYAVMGDKDVKKFEAARRKSVLAFLLKDKFGLRHYIPRRLRQILFDISSFNARTRLDKNIAATQLIREQNYKITDSNIKLGRDLVAVCSNPFK
jgi:2-polyprenyl-3-methyl-5-hydroxy-6-metoxy-1,4-benzoquinol methylase